MPSLEHPGSSLIYQVVSTLSLPTSFPQLPVREEEFTSNDEQ